MPMIFMRSTRLIYVLAFFLCVYCAIPALAGSEDDIQEALNLLAMEQYIQARTILKGTMASEPDNALAELLMG